MKKTKLFTAAIAGILATSTMIIPAHALSWKDGVKASNSYTFATAGEGISKVYAQDKNNTVNQTINTGETITSKNGTITWRDSYENVTAFYVAVEPGYQLTNVTVDGKNGNFYSAKEDQTVTLNSDLGKDNTYTVTANENYDYVFYFSNAGDEAWTSNHTFAIETEKIEYTITDAEGNTFGTAKIGETPNVDLRTLQDTNYVTRYKLNGINWNGATPITTDMIKADSNELIIETVKEELASYEWAFTYTGTKDKNIIGDVTAQWDYDNNTNKIVNINDTVKLSTKLLTTNHMKFFICVDKAYGVKGVISSGKEFTANLINKNNSDYDVYEITFTRASRGEFDKAPKHEFFTLETYKK